MLTAINNNKRLLPTALSINVDDPRHKCCAYLFETYYQ